MASKEIGPGGVEIWRSKGGVVKLSSPAPGVMHSAFSGDIPEELALPYVAFLQKVLPQAPRAVVFVDATETVNHETAFRLRATQGHKLCGDRIEAVHVIVRSKAVTAAIKAVNLVIGNVVAHSSRAAFDAALAKAIARRGSPP